MAEELLYWSETSQGFFDRLAVERFIDEISESGGEDFWWLAEKAERRLTPEKFNRWIAAMNEVVQVYTRKEPADSAYVKRVREYLAEYPGRIQANPMVEAIGGDRQEILQARRHVLKSIAE